MGLWGRISSTSKVALSAILRAPQLPQKPRRLQLKPRESCPSLLRHFALMNLELVHQCLEIAARATFADGFFIGNDYGRHKGARNTTD